MAPELGASSEDAPPSAARPPMIRMPGRAYRRSPEVCGSRTATVLIFWPTLGNDTLEDGDADTEEAGLGETDELGLVELGLGLGLFVAPVWSWTAVAAVSVSARSLGVSGREP